MGGSSDAGEEGGFCLAAGADDAAGAVAGDVAVTMMALGIVDALDGCWDCLTVSCRRL